MNTIEILKDSAKSARCLGISIFDPEKVTDNSSWEDGKNTLPSTGIPYVLMNGVPVVDGSEVRDGLTPGVAIRRVVAD